MKGKMNGKMKGVLLIAVFILSTIAILPIAYAAPIVALSDTSGHVGDEVTVTITATTMGGLVKVYWDSVKAWDGTAGLLAEDYAVGSTAEIDIVIPEAVNGEHYLIVKDMESSTLDSNVFEIIPEIELAQTAGIAGDTITITGTGFPGSQTLDIFFGDAEDTSAFKPHGLQPVTVGTYEWDTAPGTGHVNAIKLESIGSSEPGASVYLEDGPTLEEVSTRLGDFGFSYYTDTADATHLPYLMLRFEAPDSIDPDDGTSDHRGHLDITFFGLGLTEDEAWTTYSSIATDKTVWAYGNTPSLPVDYSAGPSGDWAAAYTFYTNPQDLEGDEHDSLIATDWVLTRVSVQPETSQGPYWVDDVKVPMETEVEGVFAPITYDLEPPVKTTTSGPLGSFTATYTTSVEETEAAKIVSVIGDVDNSVAFAAFDMGVCITLTPSTGITGTEITVLGRGFTPDETVDVRWYYPSEYTEGAPDTGSRLTVVNDYPIDSTGVFTTTFNVPLVDTDPSYEVVAIDSEATPVISPSVTFSVTGVTEITLSASSGLVGDTFDVDGVWFTPSKTAEITFDGTVLATSVAIDSSGVLTQTNVEVPDVALGSYTVTVTDEEDIFATKTFTVIEEVITIETNSEAYDPGDTLSFSIESTVAFDGDTIAMVIDDPDGYTFWSVAAWTMAGDAETGFYVPYSAQVDDDVGLHLMLPSDATTGTWDWTATYTIDTVETEETGTFTVGEPVGPQPDLPAETTDQEPKDSSGVPKTSFVLGETVLASSTVSNIGTQSQSMVIIVQWTDPDLRALAPVFLIVELDAGDDFTYAPGLIIPITGYATGTWTANIMVLTDWPAQGGVTIGAPVTLTITVG